MFRDFHGIQFGRVKVFPADRMHACSGVHHNLSFLQLCCGCGRQTPLIGRWKECGCVCFIELVDIANLHASPRAHRSCLSVSYWDRSSNFGAYGLRWWGFLIWITPSDGLLISRTFGWRSVAFENFQKSHCTLSPSFFLFFAGLIFNLPVHQRAFITKFASHIREDAQNHKMVSCTHLWCDLCTAAELTSQMDSDLWDSFVSEYFHHPFLSVDQSEERTLVSILLACSHRARNCNYLFSNSVFLLSIDFILLVLFNTTLTPAT